MMFKKGNKQGVMRIENVNDALYDMKNWHYSKGKITSQFAKNHIFIKSKTKKTSYLLFLEDSTNFNRISKNSSKISCTDKVIIETVGNNLGKLDFTLFFLEYDKNNKRIRTNRVKLNDSQIIATQQETVYARVAIRLEGKGSIELTKIGIRKYGMDDILANVGGKSMHDIRLACIFDEFSTASLSHVVNLQTFTPDNWQVILEQEKPDVLMVESAWKGNNGTWEFEIATYNNNDNNQKLKELLSWCRENQIPTVFWNKEDPVHFDKFKKTAALFDYVFTTDADMISSYKNYIGHQQVNSLQFAANPVIHNPISAKNKKKDRISFAGSYYSNRHPERKKDMDEVLTIAHEFGLDIFDRNYGKSNTDFNFPEKYKNNILGSLPYHQIDKAYKDYRLVLNVNSVKYSPTMFSRRVFEALACGTPVISSKSVGIKKTFRQLVTINENDTQFRNEINQLMTDQIIYRKKSMEGMREIFRKHTYKERMEYILDTIGVQYRKDREDVTVIFHLTKKEQIDRALEVIGNQTYKQIKILFVLDLFEGHEEIISNYNKDNYLAYLLDYTKRYEPITELLNTKYVTVMNIEHDYGEHYLEDLMHACMYSNAEIVGKKELMDKDDDYHYGEFEYQYVDSVIEETTIFKLEDVKYYSIKDLLYNRKIIMNTLYKQNGSRIFSGDKFNFSFGNERSYNHEKN